MTTKRKLTGYETLRLTENALNLSFSRQMGKIIFLSGSTEEAKKKCKKTQTDNVAKTAFCVWSDLNQYFKVF